MRGRGRSTAATVTVVAVGLAAVTAVVLAARHRDDGAADAPVPAGAVEANAVVGHVVDGDTVDLLIDGHDERVRLIGVNTPETVARDRPVECYGPEASAYLKALLPAGTPVRIERDVEPRDDYGRLLGYVMRATDGLFVNLELVWQGYAVPLSIEPNTAHAQEFTSAAVAAERAERGLWGACHL